MFASMTHNFETVFYSAFIVGAPESVYSVFTGRRVRRHDTAAQLSSSPGWTDQSSLLHTHVPEYVVVLAPRKMLICFCFTPLSFKLAHLRPAQFGVTHQDASMRVTSALSQTPP